MRRFTLQTAFYLAAVVLFILAAAVALGSISGNEPALRDTGLACLAAGLVIAPWLS